ncbi:MAG: fibronectin type III domain-containing protein [Ruminococcaceae bacterium]|nr:fibronectin type III domain-containing protein [Oscillospiraceae bacterium]
MKKTLSLILAFVMLLSVTAGLNITVFASNTVSSVYLCNGDGQKLDLGPIDGENPCFNIYESDNKVVVDTESEARTYTNGVRWQDTATYQMLQPTDTFEANHTYELRVILKCADGYIFNTKEGHIDVKAHLRHTIVTDTVATFYVEGDVEEYNADTIIVSKTFTCPGIQDIAEAEISMTAPQDGKRAFYNSNPSGSKFYIDETESSTFLGNKIRWYNVTEGWFLTEEDVFEAGNVYEAYVRLRPNKGYQFTEDTVVKFGSTTATIQSQAADYITAYVDYTLYYSVKDVEMTIDVDFSPSKPAAFFANSEEPDRYYCYDYNDDAFVSGVCYKDLTNDSYMEVGGLPFFQGHEYSVTVAVTCQDANKFSGLNVITSSINGVDAEVSARSPFGERVEGVYFFTANLGTCAKDLNDCTVAYPKNAKYVYNGKKQKLQVIITDKGELLVEGTDYEILYMGSHTNVGKVNFEIIGLGEYKGSKSGSFNITAKPMSSGAKINISGKTFTYDGKIKQPTVTVYDGSTKLKKNTDYTVSYSYTKSKNVGEYSVKVTFKGNYSGSKSITYTIIPKGTTLLKTASTGKDWISPQWNKQTTQTTGYEIMYSKSAGFRSGNKTVTVSDNKQTVKKIKSLKKNTKYYFKIRTYKKVKINGRYKVFYSSWSPVKEFKTRK